LDCADVAAALLALFACAVVAPTAHAEVRWMCSPALPGDPCRGEETTRVFAPDGSSRVEPVAVPAAPAVDCFYVYPTASNQLTPNATQTAEPEIRSIATFQARPFSSRCRVFAPLYRQVTGLGASLASQARDTTPYELALADVREAFQQYLRDDNHGRGFVLLGHAQGSRMLRALIRRDVDGDAAVRSRLVSAVIPGANVTVARGRRVGGDFENVAACDSAGQTGCVVSFHTFGDPPPADTRFGRTESDPVGGALGLPVGGETEVLCTDPAALTGTGGRLETLLPSEPFAPGTVALELAQLFGGPPPRADTPWLTPTDHYTARCERAGGTNVLRIAPVGTARTLTPSPDATWGLHLVDLNLPLGNLLRLVDAQTNAFLAAHRPVSLRLRARKVRKGRRQLLALVLGAPGAELRVALRRGGRLLTRRTLTLDDAGIGHARFRIGRAGSYAVSIRAADGTSLRSRPRRITLR
jgi:hypothetical protein